MPNNISPAQRQAVKDRDRLRCFRCGGKGSQWHHRRTRSVQDEHQHDACNGVWLCITCHRWVHSHPTLARHVGLIVSRHEADPGSIPATAFFGVLLLGCDGKYTHYKE